MNSNVQKLLKEENINNSQFSFVGQHPQTKELRNLEQSVDLRQDLRQGLRQDLRQGQAWMTTNDHIAEVKKTNIH